MDEETEGGLCNTISISKNGQYIKYTTRQLLTGRTSFWFTYAHAERSDTQYMPYSWEAFSRKMTRKRLVINPRSL